MSRHWTLALAAGVALAVSGSSRADQDPKDVVRQAISAMGGIENLRQVHAMHMKVRGHEYVSNGDIRPIEMETWVQYPDRIKQVEQTVVDGQKVSATIGMAGNDVWISEDGVPSAPEAWRRSAIQEGVYEDYVSLLWPLVDNKDYTLTVVPAAPVKGQAVVAVLVAKAGQPDVTLCFDRDNHLLVKTQMQIINPKKPGGKSLQEEMMSEYRSADFKNEDEKQLREKGLRTDDAELLSYLKQKTLPEAERLQAQKLIQQLGDPSFEVRAKAQQQLAKLGADAAPIISRAAQSQDAEIASAAKEWLQKANVQVGDPETTASVLRLLGARKTPGALDAIMLYLPSASSDTLAGEAQNALTELAAVDGKPDPALGKFTSDADSLRRSTAEKLQASIKSSQNKKTSQRLSLKDVKFPHQYQYYLDGKKQEDFKVEELELYSGLADEVFAKP